MGKALHNLEADDANEIDNGPFELYNLYTILKFIINPHDCI